MPYVFPTRLFNPGTIKPGLIGAQQAGGRSLSGIVQNADLSGGGYWTVEFGEIALLGRAKVLAWRRLAAALAGGGTSVDVPLADRRHQPIAAAYTGTDTYGLNTYEDDAFWLPGAGEQISVFSFGGGLARDTTISFITATTLLGGEHFTMQDNTNFTYRLHRITRIISHVGNDYVAEIRPPLRVNSYFGQPMNFDSPRCTMRLDGDMEATLEMLRFGKASVRFLEDFPPVSSGGNSPGNSP